MEQLIRADRKEAAELTQTIIRREISRENEEEYER